MKKTSKHAGAVKTLQEAVSGEQFTTQEFRERIAAICRIPGAAPVFRNSAHPSIVCKTKGGDK